jgi:triacylglycerol esterase/lipase EstA (alpha/beta hydrolase family)
LKQKLKLLNKEKEMAYQDETLSNIVFKMDNLYEECKPGDLPVYPVIVHETQKYAASNSTIDASDTSSEQSVAHKIRYILVLAHGYQGAPEDLALFANGFKKRYKKSKYLILKSYRNKMGVCLHTMAESAVEEIDKYLDELDHKDRIYRVVMIGHSMGGLVLRIAANQIKRKELLYAYLSLGTPHLGYLQGLKLHIRAGLSLFSSMYSNPCLNEFSGKDAP